MFLIALYSCFFSKGIGTRTAALYVAWARQFEQKGMNEQADAVYQKALENQAHPASVVLHEYNVLCFVSLQCRNCLPKSFVHHQNSMFVVWL
uniref:BUB1 N-terminal domain-containing protein n=1 Tax=Amphilophus citrinellus TaxID=61819 RepID=A0A3Q0QWK4_AMPCI